MNNHKVLRKGKMKLEYKLIVLFFLCFLFPMLLINIISANNMDSIVEDNASKNLKERVGMTVNNIEQLLDDFDSIGETVTNDTKLMEKMTMHSDSYPSALEYILAQDEIYTFLANLLIKNKYAESLYVYNSEGYSFCINNSDTVDKAYTPYQEEWYKIARSSGEKHLLTEHTDMQTSGKRQRVLSYIYPVFQENSGDSFVIVINFSADTFTFSIADTQVGGSDIMITDGSFIGYADTATKSGYTRMALQALKKDGDISHAGEGETSSYIYKEKLDDTGWYVVGVTSEAFIKRDITQFRVWMLVFTAIMTVLMVGVSFGVSAVLTKPLKSMQQLTRRVRTGAPGAEYQITDIKGNRFLKDEYQVFADTINDLLHQINVSMKIQQKQEQDMLQAQINPHFIYNTLNTVKWTAKMEGNLQTEEAVAALINLLKSTLNVNRTFISISEEIRQIEDYIKVQRFRYSDGFATDISFDEQVLELKTLKFVLQPVVENAVFHGLDMESGSARLEIAIRKQADTVVYTVRDNGCGMTSEQLEDLLRDSGERKMMTGIGMINVNQRIKKYFGSEFGITVESEVGSGTSVTIRIPAQPFGSEEEA